MDTKDFLNGSLIIKRGTTLLYTRGPLLPLTQVVFVACGVSRLAGLMDCFPSNTSQNDCRDNCRVTCPCGYYDGKAWSTCGGSCVLAAPLCCCAAGNRAPLPCCARCDDLRYAVVACRAPRGSTAIVNHRARGGALRGGWGVWLASSWAPAEQHADLRAARHLVLRLRGGMQIFAQPRAIHDGATGPRCSRRQRDRWLRVPLRHPGQLAQANHGRFQACSVTHGEIRGARVVVREP